MTTIKVIKRNGSKQDLDIEKLHKVCNWACENINNVSVSELELKSKLKFFNNIKTSDIQETLIKSACDLISEETPNYQYVAGRLINYHLRKEVYEDFNPIDLLTHIKNVVKENYYDEELLNSYTENEINEFNNYIKHDRDFNIPFCGMEQWRAKYLIRNRLTKKYYETPQMAYMIISMMMFLKDTSKDRNKFVKDFYDEISNFRISLPTPIMGGLRSKQKQFSSCVLIDCDDSLDSINATTFSIVKYVAQKAGIGINGGAIRAVNSPIRNGDTVHTGVIPFWKVFDAAISSCSQGGIRKGSGTIHWPIWHYEFEDLIVLKNNKGTVETRIRTMDYSVQISKLFYERYLNNENISFFSPSEVPGLYESFYKDQKLFEELYTNAEKNENIRKKVLSAREVFSHILTERKNTGRIYIMNVDNVNNQGPFINSAIKQSNLCQEILNPTVPLKDINDPNGEIALCTLAAQNFSAFKNFDDLNKSSYLLVRGLDNLLSYQDYPILAAKNTTEKRRFLGIGIVNFAHFLAKNNLTYQNIDKNGLQFLHEWFEAWSFGLISASISLAEERGSCLSFEDLKYSKGIFPIDTYKKDVDNLVEPVYKQDWDSLREKAKIFGIRNSTLMAQMPAETSAVAASLTNGVEPVKSLITIKQSKDGVFKQIVPDFKRLKHKYDLVWDQKSPEGYLKIMAVLQKFIDNGISVNTSYNPKFYDDEKLSMKEIVYHLLLHYKYGGKTLYYFNTNDQAGEIEIKDSVSNSPLTEEDCESCKL